MWKRLDVDMTSGTTSTSPLSPEKRLGGRALISLILLEEMNPQADPLGADNLLIICNGILAGTPASTSGRLSVGTKSPLTLGIKESNSGGLAGKALASLGLRCIVISGKATSNTPQILVLEEDKATLVHKPELAGLKTYEACQKLHAEFGEKAAIICAGPAAEQGSLMSSLQITDMQGNPARSCGRGGTGAVLASKGLKAIIIKEKNKAKPDYYNYEAFLSANKAFAKCINTHPVTSQVFPRFGTASLVSAVNEMGALPTRNFSTGNFDLIEGLTAEHIEELQKKRKGQMRHACQPGCLIHCSNVFNDEQGNYKTSGFEYETIALTGANLGIGNIDAVASIDRACDEIGIDTIETGVVIALAMQAGVLHFGDSAGALDLIEQIGKGTTLGKELGQGAERFAKSKGITRIPCVKKQGIAGYDPRALKGTGVTYATSPMGADHTCGNTLRSKGIDPLKPEGQTKNSFAMQSFNATIDSTGLCLFASMALHMEGGMQSLVDMLNALDNGGWTAEKILRIGQDSLARETQFNQLAGITTKDDDVPAFMREERLPPHNSVFDVPKEELDKFCKTRK